MNDKSVSVLITSFNQARLLPRAIDGVLSQKTNFKFEVIIVDDGSTDGSKEIISGYGDRVSPVFNHHGGMMKTYDTGFKYCDGKYVAFCDCDDYWCNDNKLQIQFDYMESHPDIGVCLTKINIEKDGEIIQELRSIKELQDSVTYNYLLMGKAYIHAQSYFLRRSEMPDFGKFIKLGFKRWDFPLMLSMIQHSKFVVLDFTSAVYHQKNESFTQTSNRKKRLAFILDNYYIRLYYILHYRCSINTLLFLIYRFLRDLISVIFKRWIKS
jgi:glycosyltransferase involved in cell wall biosynthesis